MIWPLPALLVWGVAWGMFIGLRSAGTPVWVGLVLCSAFSALLSTLGTTRWRQAFMGLGFPLSLLLSGLAGPLSPWLWLFPLLALLAIYPPRTWTDAPLFPTPRGSLHGMAALAPLPAGARVADAGCGIGDGLLELHAEYPHARLEGLEWSQLLTQLCAWRCRWLQVPVEVRRADFWAADWSPLTMVYLFQRPESMPRAIEKAAAELSPGHWLASLEFEADELQPTAVHTCPDGRRVWLYQQPFKPRQPA